jgi:hypothetical protein
MSDFKEENPVNLGQYRMDKTHAEFEDNRYRTLEHVREHEKEAPRKFLDAWKRGLMLVGSEFFIIKSEQIDTASDKWQLTPNLEFILKASGSYSEGKKALLALMYSFYDSEDGQKLLENNGTPNFVSAYAKLDFEGRQIISQLLLNYSGW